MGDGLHATDWGSNTNLNLTKIEQAIGGVTSKALTGGTYSLSTSEAGAAILVFTGTLGSDEVVTLPAITRFWIVSNQMVLAGHSLSLRIGSGTPVVIPATTTVTPIYWSDATTLTPVADQSTAIAAITTTANAALARAGGTMSGTLNMGSQVLTGLTTPSSSSDATTKTYVDSAVATLTTAAAAAQTTANAALPKAGGTMTGAIAMGGSKVTGLGSASASGDALTKGDFDAIPKLFAKGTVDTSGNTLGGAYNIASVTAGGSATVTFTTAATSQYSFTCTVSAYGAGGETSATIFAQSTTTVAFYATNAAGSVIGAAFNFICFQ